MVCLFFSTIEVTRQVFYRTAQTYAIVNLKPIVPGHVLVCPCRPVPRLADLDSSELTSLITSVQHVGKVIERVYGADALTVSCQDGKAAGQSIPHVHFHLLPRHLHGDRFSRNDDIYPALERAEASLSQNLQAQGATGGGEEGHEPLKVDADEDRAPRGIEEMVQEAEWLKKFFEQSS
ncbi:hypothetical protein JAAARDRAFT_29147 [Jaapia argillacea MUCL 33604]|uniref:Bis(5'-adenosyl)-triphosphatase n=1 Tax=Jaapia argillacea MUCL 33604 TaxID=933084 RepID=A0A067QKJ0_9AGAM|nr:hypothetical protein JAAARDRAFT_29147 [Jaapia argillacea MUCL 33604]